MKAQPVTLKLVVAFAVLIAILLGIGWLGLSRMALMDEKVSEISDRCWPKVQLSREALHYSTVNSRITMQIFLLKAAEDVAPLLAERDANTEKISSLLKRIEERVESETERALVARIRASRLAYNTGFKEALELSVKAGQPTAGREMMSKAVTPHLVLYHKAWEDFVNFQGSHMDQAGKNAQAYYITARHLVNLLLALALVLAGGVAIFVTRGMTREIGNRLRAEKELRAAHEALERRVEVRTEELSNTNTNLTAAHHELLVSEQRFRTLCASAPIGIFLTDASGRILYTNPYWQSVANLSLEKSLGEGWLQAVHPDESARVHGEWQQTLAEGGEFDGQFRFGRDGEVRWVHTQLAAIRSDVGEVTGHVGTVENITERKQAEEELHKAQKELVEASRQAGMAEVATAVLHNVGNVLNSVNVTSNCVADALRRSKAGNLARVSALLEEHETDLCTFLTEHPKGRQLPSYLKQLSKHLAREHAEALEGLAGLQKNIDHIKDIVTMQQGFARFSGMTETVVASELVEDALKMNASSLARHDVQIIKDFDQVPPCTVEKHKVLQILVNLIRNGKEACDESNCDEKKLTIRLQNGEGRIRISVIDNGIGIPATNLTNIFAYGFTTKKDGHGFGLHSGALAAKEMGGSLTAHSDGQGCGSRFTLELPALPAPTYAN